MIEHFARSTAVISRSESIDQEIIGRETPVYDLHLRENVRDDFYRVKNLASLWKQQYVWGKFGKSCGLSIVQANDVFDASVAEVAYKTRRVVSTVVYLAKNASIGEKISQLPQRFIKPKTA